MKTYKEIRYGSIEAAKGTGTFIEICRGKESQVVWVFHTSFGVNVSFIPPNNISICEVVDNDNLNASEISETPEWDDQF